MTEFSFSHVNKNFGFKPVLKDLSFEVMTGERAALIGRNGTGKSTILKLLAGEEIPDSGKIVPAPRCEHCAFGTDSPPARQRRNRVRRALRAVYGSFHR